MVVGGGDWYLVGVHGWLRRCHLSHSNILLTNCFQGQINSFKNIGLKLRLTISLLMFSVRTQDCFANLIPYSERLIRLQWTIFTLKFEPLNLHYVRVYYSSRSGHCGHTKLIKRILFIFFSHVSLGLSAYQHERVTRASHTLA